MRSEERSGIIFIVLLLLWGTLISEPFRYFATIINDGLLFAFDKVGLASHHRIEVLLVTVVMVGLVVLLLNISKTSASNYFGPFFSSMSLLVFLIRCLIAKSVDYKTAIILIISVVLITIIMFIKSERIWIWIADIYIFSLPIFLLSAWVFTPIANISDKASKIMFVALKSHMDFASYYKGLLTLPGIVWGVFFAIIMMLPVIYFIVGRRKG